MVNIEPTHNVSESRDVSALCVPQRIVETAREEIGRPIIGVEGNVTNNVTHSVDLNGVSYSVHDLTLSCVSV